MAFEIAGSHGASRKRPQKAEPVLLEPIMKVEVVTPEDYMGDVIGDLNSPPRPDPGHGQRAATRRSSTRMVPLAEMFGYVDRPPVDDAGPRRLTPCSSSTYAAGAGSDRAKTIVAKRKGAIDP
jgi:elongation factor G